MRIIWSPRAILRAQEAAEFIALDKPSAASDWLDGLVRAVERLERFPKSGRVTPEFGRAEIREVQYHAHRVVYEIAGSEVHILTVRRSRMLLDEDELV